jgi:hypothetical protein
MFSSVRSRLTVWYAAVLSCSLLLLSLVIYFIVKQSVLARMDAGLVELSDSFLATLDAELRDAPAAEGITGAARQSMLEHQYPGHSFAVLTSSGEPIALSSELPSAAPQSHGDTSPEISARALETCLAALDTPPKFFRGLPGKRGGARCYARTFVGFAPSGKRTPQKYPFRSGMADPVHDCACVRRRLLSGAQEPGSSFRNDGTSRSHR